MTLPTVARCARTAVWAGIAIGLLAQIVGAAVRFRTHPRATRWPLERARPRSRVPTESLAGSRGQGAGGGSTLPPQRPGLTQRLHLRSTAAMHRGTRSLDDTRGGVPVYFLGLTVLAVAMLVGTRLWDAPSQPLLSLLASMASLDPGAAGAILATAAEVTAGVLAIAMTVVAIVVELAANRYSHRITFLFIREPVNVVVLSLFLLTTLQCVWMAAILADPSQSDTPRAGVALSLGLVSLSLLTLLPYFAFVFSFISPLNVIDRIRRLASRAIEGASDARLDAAPEPRVGEHRRAPGRGARRHREGRPGHRDGVRGLVVRAAPRLREGQAPDCRRPGRTSRRDCATTRTSSPSRLRP